MAFKKYVLFMIFTNILFEIWSKSYAELYTAISDLPPLLNTYKLVIDDLDEYIQKEEKRICALKKNLDVFKKEHAIAMKDIPNYLGHPINAFALIKRLAIDLKVIEDRADLTTEYFRNVINSHADYAIFPSTKDLFGAAIALKRLQETYKLQVHELAEGKINGVPHSLPMSADDCFGMGRVLYNIADYNNSIKWTLKALSKYEDEVETDVYSFTPVDAMEQISSSYYKLGDDRSASVWKKRSETISYPDYDFAQTNLNKLFEIEITHDMVKEEKDLSAEINGTNMSSDDMYMALCRGEYEPAPEITKKVQDLGFIPRERYTEIPIFPEDLPSYRPPGATVTIKPGKYRCCSRDRPAAFCPRPVSLIYVISENYRLTCFYLNKNHQFLRLAAIKAEQLHIDPDIFVFYDVISDREIEHVKAVAKPRIKRAEVHDETSNTGVTVAYFRVGKSAFIKSDDVICRISQRIADFTGLSMEFAEQLHVVNYGLGGHYEPHYDHTLKDQTNHGFHDTKEGNRIATVLFYMSKVAQGGATVFTELGLSVFPVKNAALFWMNLHPSGEGDLSTKHAGCPVLRGSKWIITKWIRILGQEFRRPCSLEYQKEGVLQYYNDILHRASRF